MNKLEEQMKGMMDGASLQDLMPDFDKEAFWVEVAAKVPEQQPKKKIIPFGWALRVAAVLLVGIGIWSAVRFSGHHTLATEERVATTVPSSSPQIIKQPVAAPVPQQAVAPAPVNNITQLTRPGVPLKMVPQQQQTMQALPNEPKVANETGSPLGNLIPAEIPVARVQKKVTHYLDIDDDAAPTAAATAAAPFIQIKLNKPGTPEQNLQQKPFKELTLALAR